MGRRGRIDVGCSGGKCKKGFYPSGDANCDIGRSDGFSNDELAAIDDQVAANVDELVYGCSVKLWGCEKSIHLCQGENVKSIALCKSDGVNILIYASRLLLRDHLAIGI